MIIAVDFDGTLFVKGKANLGLFDYCRRAQMNGNQVVLYTSRKGESLKQAVQFCAARGLRFNGVVGGKFRADMYIDDKVVKP